MCTKMLLIVNVGLHLQETAKTKWYSNQSSNVHKVFLSNEGKKF